MTTNVPEITWVDGAPVLPTELDILAGVQADQSAAFGGGLNTSLTTPQGQLAQSETAIIADKNSQIAFIAAQVNPETASGIWQDGIGKLYNLTRIPAAGTVVSATCTGAVGVTIPAGSVAQDTAGYLYSSTASVTIGAGGTVTAQFQNQTPGPFACAIGALNTIYTAIAGWDTITNAAAGAVGNYVESRAAFEARRQLSVAFNSVNSLGSILSNILAVADVLDAAVVDNTTGSTIYYGATDYPLVAHSVLASVAGGDSTDVATALWEKKPVGVAYNGNTTVSITDTSNGYPYSTYSVTFLIPTSTPIYFAVQIKSNPALPTDIDTLVSDAIIAAFTGTDGGVKARINQAIYASRFYAGISAIDPNISIAALTLGFTAMGATLTALDIGVDQLPTIDASQISVALV